MTATAQVVALSGGVGGAKLAHGLLQALPADALSLILNTGDDFLHLGLHISPDVDTALYTLAGLANRQTGWGRQDETWSFMEALAQIGGETWFRLGDGDLATHVERSRRLLAGERLSTVAAAFAARLGIRARLLPMSDDPVRTRALTDEGAFDFQHYFVLLQCRPRIHAIDFAGAASARPTPEIIAALHAPGLEAVVICPSNPYLSIDPILALPGVKRMLADTPAPVIAVAPIVGGQAIKGPTAKIMRELGVEPSAAAVAAHYADFLDGYVVDAADTVTLPGPRMISAGIVMKTLADKVALARRCVAFSDELAGRS